MISKRKNQICALLKGIETGDAEAVAVVNEDKYIQHTPQEDHLVVPHQMRIGNRVAAKVRVVEIFSAFSLA